MLLHCVSPPQGLPSAFAFAWHALSAHVLGSAHSGSTGAIGSSHGVPVGEAPNWQTPVAGSHVVRHSSKHPGQLESPVQVPFSQWSFRVQRLLSLQVVPSGFGPPEHVPVAGLQVPALRHWVAAQVTGLLPVHVPLWHVSVWVHAFASLQTAPFAFAGFEHNPVAGLHVPALWH